MIYDFALNKKISDYSQHCIHF